MLPAKRLLAQKGLTGFKTLSLPLNDRLPVLYFTKRHQDTF
jgi:hypothetical protein